MSNDSPATDWHDNKVNKVLRKHVAKWNHHCSLEEMKVTSSASRPTAKLLYRYPVQLLIEVSSEKPGGWFFEMAAST